MHHHEPGRAAPDNREFTFEESLAEALFGAFLYTIGCSFFCLAIFNLLFLRPLPPASLVASLLWTAFIGGLAGSACHRLGVRQYVGNVLGNLTRNRFARLAPGNDGESLLSFGYQWGSRQHLFLKLKARGIQGIDWGPGQGNVPGKDRNWNVVLWFDPNSVVFDGDRYGIGIYIVGPSGPKPDRETFGRSFIDFLQQNRVQITLPPATLLGQVADVATPLDPFGWIRIGDEEYRARPVKQRIDRGKQVVIEEIRGTSVYVRLVDDPMPPTRTHVE
jgi:hypothetical protein